MVGSWLADDVRTTEYSVDDQGYREGESRPAEPPVSVESTEYLLGYNVQTIDNYSLWILSIGAEKGRPFPGI